MRMLISPLSLIKVKKPWMEWNTMVNERDHRRVPVWLYSGENGIDWSIDKMKCSSRDVQSPIPSSRVEIGAVMRGKRLIFWLVNGLEVERGYVPWFQWRRGSASVDHLSWGCKIFAYSFVNVVLPSQVSPQLHFATYHLPLFFVFYLDG